MIVDIFVCGICGGIVGGLIALAVKKVVGGLAV